MDDDLAYKGALNGIGAQGGDAVYVNSFDGPFVKIVSDPLLAKFGFGSKQDCYTQIRWFEIRTHRTSEEQMNYSIEFPLKPTRLDAKQQEELEFLLQDARLCSSRCESMLRMVGDVDHANAEKRIRCIDPLKMFHHTVVHEFMEAETEAETQLDTETETKDVETEASKVAAVKSKKQKQRIWTDTELHEYWMRILRGTYQLTVRRYVCALRIAKLVVPEPIDSQSKVYERVQVVKYLMSMMVPAPYSVFRRRTPLHHAHVDDFRRDAMQRMNLNSIRAEGAFEDKYNEEYFTRAVALSRKLEKEIVWLRRCIERPSCDVMF